MKLVFRRLRTFFWLSQSFSSRYGKLVIGGFIVGIIAFILLVYTFPLWRGIMPQQREVIGIIGSYRPANLPLSVQNLVSRGLTKVTENGEAEPDLASSWQVDQDGKRYFFYLNKGVFWHDGKEFSAYDVNYNFKDVTIQAADRYILKIELSEPFAPLPTLLSRPLFKTGLIGNGDYKIFAIELKGEYVDKLTLRPVNREKKILQFRFYPGNEQAITAFKLGEVERLENVTDARLIPPEKNLKIKTTVQTDRLLAVFFNLHKDFLKKKEVRQALSYATPAIEGQTEIFSPIPESSWAYNAQVKKYDYNLDLAKTTLSKSEASLPESLTLSTFPEYLEVAQKIADSWNTLGFKTQVKVVRSFNEDFDAFLGVQELPPDPDQYLLWHSTQEQSRITGYSNPRIDKLLEDGRITQDKDERLAVYLEFQRHLVDDAPAKFLNHPTVYSLSRK